MSYEFADRLIELRRARALSQEDLAGKIGVSRQAVSKWERAESAPDIGNLVALSQLYKVSLDELVRGAEVFSGDSQETFAGEVVATTQEASADESAAGAQETPANEMAAETQEASVDEVAAQAVLGDQPEHAQSAPIPEPVATPAPAPAAAAGTASFHTSRAWRTFPYPLLCVVVFLFFGFFLDLWHPAWVIFLTIPFYYWVFNIIAHDPNYIAAHGGPQVHARAASQAPAHVEPQVPAQAPTQSEVHHD